MTYLKNHFLKQNKQAGTILPFMDRSQTEAADAVLKREKEAKEARSV